ncbi:MAG: hypothetical protein QF774_16260, partial [Nitrospinota bacterium]|nr:hypothetical protein [Nitrospinota bacterium]
MGSASGGKKRGQLGENLLARPAEIPVEIAAAASLPPTGEGRLRTGGAHLSPSTSEPEPVSERTGGPDVAAGPR